MATVDKVSINAGSLPEDTFNVINENDDAINTQLVNHISGGADNHAAQDVTYTGSVPGQTQVKGAIDALKSEVDTIIASSGTSDTEVVQARDSAVKGKVFTVLDNRLEEIEQDKIDAIDNSFAMDANRYIGNQKKVFLGSDNWAQGGGIQSSSSDALVGNTSLRITENDNIAGNMFSKIDGLSLDLSKLFDGSDSPDSDLIGFLIKPSDFTKVVNANIAFSTDAVYGGNNMKVLTVVPSKNDWELFDAQKSALNTVGSFGGWDNVQSISVFWNSTENAQNEYVDFNLGQLVKEDPDFPGNSNAFQKSGVRELAINSGIWYVGEEYDQYVIKELSGTTTRDGLKGVKEFENCNITLKKRSTDAVQVFWGASLLSDLSNYINCYVSADEFFIQSTIGGVASNNSTSFPTDANDILTFNLQKDGSNVTASVFKNNDPSTLVPLAITTTLESGFLAIGNTLSGIVTVDSGSITKLDHAHHSDIAEVARTIQMRVKNGAFLAAELDFGVFGIDTANNRLYIKMPDGTVKYSGLT